MASNVKVLPSKSAKPPPPEDDEDDDPPDCPRCPPVGAPAWMATFADMATLLMAFFVLILGFANFDEVSFRKMAGSMRESFGIQPIMPSDAVPPGTVLEMDYFPSNTPPSEQDSREPPSGEQDQGNAESGKGPVEAAAMALTQAVREAMADGELTVESDQGEITVKLPPGAGEAEAQALADAIAKAAGTEAEHAAGDAETVGNGSGPGGASEGGDTEGGPAAYTAGMAEARLQVALREEIEKGLVQLEQREGKVFITVGSGGAFPSGSDELTDEARGIIDRLGAAADGKNAKVTVTGHTDDVQINGGKFRDNWDLAAARASAVVRAIGETGAVAPQNMTATSRGESDPVADNSTEEGRELNRRIEIEVSFEPEGTEP